MLQNVSYGENVQNNSKFDYDALEEEVTRDIFSEKQMVEFEEIINSSNKNYLNDISDMQMNKRSITDVNDPFGSFK